jgi:kynurenine 3-monooxygenase
MRKFAFMFCRHLGMLTNSAKRSINLALSFRGQCGLENVGLLDTVMKNVVKMSHRAVHVTGQPLSLQPYGVGDQAIYSVSRSLLNSLLLDELAKVCHETDM